VQIFDAEEVPDDAPRRERERGARRTNHLSDLGPDLLAAHSSVLHILCMPISCPLASMLAVNQYSPFPSYTLIPLAA
jgi:hypothetical protein